MTDTTVANVRKRKHVLIAEDDPNIRTILQFTLEGCGHQVTAVDNGKTALETARKIAPHLILLDVMMPGKNGLEVCYELKNDPKMEHIPVMILTATTQASTKTDDYWRVRSRADDFMSKPFKSADLIKRVEKLLSDGFREKGDGQGRLRI